MYRKETLIFLILTLLVFRVIAQQKPVVIGYLCTTGDSIKNSAKTLLEELNKVKGNALLLQCIKRISDADIILADIKELKERGLNKQWLNKLKGLSSESAGIFGDGMKVYLTGNSAAGVQHAVFKYLYHLGFRYYFPQPEWFIYPVKVSLFPVISYFSKPSFAHRSLWYAYGPGSEEVGKRYIFWKKANCLDGELDVKIGHSYDVIVDRNRETFLKHPEWLTNMKTAGVLPPNPKFDVSNPSLVNFIIEDTKEQLRLTQKKGPPAKMISLSPSDDIGICNKPSCQKLGNLTDRVFCLVNQTAKAIRKEFPGTKIGCLAYSEYITPPAKPVEDNVYVSLTTAFNASKYSLEELIGLWAKKTKHLGIYDYQALYAWDYDLPGQCMASATHLLAPAIQKYSKLGVNSYEAEINTGWINKGIGYYLLSQILWDVTVKPEKITDEFFTNCFKSSSAAVRQLYKDWSTFNEPFISQNRAARWAVAVTDIYDKEKDEVVKKRIVALAGYVKYLILYSQYKAAASQDNLKKIIDEANLHFDDEMLTYYPAMIVIEPQYSGFDLGTFIRKNLDRKYDYTIYAATIQWLKEYRKSVVLKEPLKVKVPSVNLKTLPAAKLYNLSLHDVNEEANGFYGTTYFVFQRTGNNDSYFEMQADFIEGGGSKIPVEISIYHFKNYNIPVGKPIMKFSYPDRKKWNKYSLKGLDKGLYVLKVDDFKKGFKLKLSQDINYSLFIPEGKNQEIGWVHSLYFYMPEAGFVFRFQKSMLLRLIDPNGKVYDYGESPKPEEIEVTVGENQKGIWRLTYVTGFFKPEGIYPIFGIIPSRMLYPE